MRNKQPTAGDEKKIDGELEKMRSGDKGGRRKMEDLNGWGVTENGIMSARTRTIKGGINSVIPLILITSLSEFTSSGEIMGI